MATPSAGECSNDRRPGIPGVFALSTSAGMYSNDTAPSARNQATASRNPAREVCFTAPLTFAFTAPVTRPPRRWNQPTTRPSRARPTIRGGSGATGATASRHRSLRHPPATPLVCDRCNGVRFIPDTASRQFWTTVTSRCTLRIIRPAILPPMRKELPFAESRDRTVATPTQQRNAQKMLFCKGFCLQYTGLPLELCGPAIQNEYSYKQL